VGSSMTQLTSHFHTDFTHAGGHTTTTEHTHPHQVLWRTALAPLALSTAYLLCDELLLCHLGNLWLC
jgi:hypothetical protein